MGNTHFDLRPATSDSVHPHACGEYAPTLGVVPSHFGSSPRVWGILNCQNRKIGKCRFIPTRVGNTSQGFLMDWKFAVHPHACGEYDHDKYSDVLEMRFIPTRVGNTELARGDE